MADKIGEILSSVDIDDTVQCIGDHMKGDRDADNGFKDYTIYGDIIKNCAHDLKYLRHGVSMENAMQYKDFIDAILQNPELKDILLSDLEKLQDLELIGQFRVFRNEVDSLNQEHHGEGKAILNKETREYEGNQDDVDFLNASDKRYEDFVVPNRSAYNLQGLLDRNDINPTFMYQAAKVIILGIGEDPTSTTETE